MRLLLTNDDGYDAPGLWALHEALSAHHDVVVCAPERQQSGASHRLTLTRPLRAFPLENGIPGWSVSGTPADCVKLALRALLDEPVDWVISGVNQGTNAGVLVHYSGTVAAAKEAVIMGVPALAVSVCGYLNVEYQPSAQITARLLEQLRERSLPPMTLLNVNVPNRPFSELKGTRFVPMSNSPMRDDYERRTDPRGRDYYWLTGKIDFAQNGGDDDFKAVGEQYVAISPLKLDWTDQELLKDLSSLEEDLC